MNTIYAENGMTLRIGRRGESGTTEVVFSFAAYIAEYGEGTPQLLHRRPGDALPYPCTVTLDRDAGTMTWVIDRTATDIVGTGKCELQFYRGGDLVKSSEWPVIVERAVSDPDEPAPDGYETYADAILRVGAAAMAAAQNVEDTLEARDEAVTAAASAAADREDAEAWAVGTRGGEPVTTDDETFENNSKYYAEEAGDSAASASMSEATTRSYAEHIADPVAGLVTTWLGDHITNPSNPPLDTSLTVAGAAADSAAAGHAISTVKFPLRRYAKNESGLYSIQQGGLNSNGSTSTNTARARTDYLPMSVGRSLQLRLEDDTYHFFKVLTYKRKEGSTTALEFVRGVQNSETAKREIDFTWETDELFFRVAFCDGHDNTRTLTDADYTAISEKFSWWLPTDTALTEADVPADAKAVGEQFTAVRDEMGTLTKFSVDPSTLGWSYGGLDVDTGKSTNNTKRLRLLNYDELGAILVGAGSTVKANAGYKFNVVTYASYTNNKDFVKTGYRSMGTADYTVEQGCYIRVSFGREDDAELWTERWEEKVFDPATGEPVIDPATGEQRVIIHPRALTTEGEAALTGALQLSLEGSTVKEAVYNLERTIRAADAGLHEMPDELPVDAAELYERWESLVENGFVVKYKLGEVPLYGESEDGLTEEQLARLHENRSVYLYARRQDMNFISGESIVEWTGDPDEPWKPTVNGAATNEIYRRPKILIVSGQHGNERATPSAVLAFAESLEGDSSFRELCDAFDWYFIPMVNPWGYRHSAYRKSDGLLDAGTRYGQSGYPITNYDVAENTASVHQGIRRNADGVDVNRDYSSSGFQTAEAQIVRSALRMLTQDGRKFALILDAHQFTTGPKTTNGGSYSAPQNMASAAVAASVYSKLMRAGMQTMLAMNKWLGKDETEQIVWPLQITGARAKTFRDYAAGEGFTDLSVLFEGGVQLQLFSGLPIGVHGEPANWSNPVARAFVCTQLHNYLKLLCGDLL